MTEGFDFNLANFPILEILIQTINDFHCFIIKYNEFKRQTTNWSQRVYSFFSLIRCTFIRCTKPNNQKRLLHHFDTSFRTSIKFILLIIN